MPYSKEFEIEYFPCLKLVKCYGNYQYHFLVVKKDYTNYGRNSIKTLEYICIYFCRHFFEAYRGSWKISNVNARYSDKEAIFVCKDCLQILKRYKRSTSPNFFYFVRRMLIQYFVPIKECNRIMVARIG